MTEINNNDLNLAHSMPPGAVHMPVRLRFVSESSSGRDFSAPAFFVAISFLPGSLTPTNGDVAIRSHQMIEVEGEPRTSGTYRVECTHFLHSFFGMHGTVEVMP